MKLSEDILLAIELKNKHNHIRAPINDIEKCIKDLKETGISEKQINTMVPNMFKSNNSSSYMNSPRYPEDDEILIYDLPDSWLNMINDAEEHKI